MEILSIVLIALLLTAFVGVIYVTYLTIKLEIEIRRYDKQRGERRWTRWKNE